jgi:hypothetical protein
LSDDLDLATEDARLATVTVTSRSLWRMRLLRSMPRYLVYAAAAAGLLASLRFAVSPPAVRGPKAAMPQAAPADRAAEGFAVLFARRYLSWDASAPQTSERLLAPMAGSAMTPAAGLILPASGAQKVEWAEVVQERAPARGAHVYTVAAQTDSAGLIYLTVGVVRGPEGGLALSGYPAFVAPPTAAGARPSGAGRPVTEWSLVGVVRRALRNYLADSPDELAADLSNGAPVGVSSFALALEGVQRLTWSTDDRSVLAVIDARDARGVRYTLAYELDVVDIGRRWEVSAVQMDPDQ